jgi:hypothetical protein
MNRSISKLLPLVAVLVLPLFAQAQETASSIRGRVVDASGAPASGATVVIEDQRSGSQRNLTANSSGTFFATNLEVGGPYKIVVNSTQSVEVGSLALGETYNLTINLQDASDAPIEEIISVAQQAETLETTTGPTAVFGEYELDSAVAFNRDIKDVYAIDPRLNLDGFSVNCAGKHPRFNNVTLDGVSHSDRFGLNTNGYSTSTGQPFPYAAIQQVAVELAPYDVKYGGFSACNINAVTKSGTNEFEAGVFYEWTTDSFINDELDGADLSADQAYKETKKGFNVGGPILKDKLFFFAAYEESEEPRFLAQGFSGSGNGVERDWLSQADYERVLNIAENIYGIDTGGQGGNGAQTTENYLIRLDWDINDSHSLAAIYNSYEGIQSRSSDSDANEFEFGNHYYDKGSDSETYTLIANSQWTDAFSTQLYYTDTRMDDSQVTVGPKDIGDHQINVSGFDNTIYLGADDSRQANSLFTDSKLFKVSAQYLAGDHVISGGFESEELEVFNIFVQHSVGGEWDYRDTSFGNNDAACDALSAQQRFDNTIVQDAGGADFTCMSTGIDHFELGRPHRVYYGSGGGTNNPLDAAASFVNTNNAIYLQDEYFIADKDLELTFGLRYEWIESDDTPTYNSTLSNAVGIRNDSGIDGVDILLPRLGFAWGAREDLSVRGGIGLYSGGNPNVWLGNAWSRDGITQVQLQEVYGHSASIFDGSLPTEAGPLGGSIPSVMFDEIAAISGSAGSDSFNVLIDPNYEAPSELKYSLGVTWDMPWWGVTADIDWMHTKLDDGAIYVDVSQEQTGTTLAGGPIYTGIPGAGQGNLMLTNSSRASEGDVLSILFNKSFDWGLDLMLGYANTSADDISPMTSFTGESSFNDLATNDINNPRAAPSNYQTKDRVTLRASFAREFWGDNSTRVTLMGYYQTGQPGSYTMQSEDAMQVDESTRHLLYIPDGAADPNVMYTQNFIDNDLADFNDWVSRKGLKPGFVKRNSNDSAVSSRVDLRIDQEIPLYFDGLKARAFLKIYNFTNMLNKDWGRQNDARRGSQDVISLEEDSTLPPGSPLIGGAYNFDSFSESGITDLQEFSSLWEMRLGIEMNFN